MMEMRFKQHAKLESIKNCSILNDIMRLCFSKVKGQMNSLSSLNI